MTEAEKRFILHWGEMGTRWGINRSVGQIHALLFISPAPLPADVISTTLGIARSNVSTSLRELESWGIVRAVHQLGDRREHYTTIQDVWEMFRTIVEHRKRREIDPTIALIGEWVAATAGEKDAFARQRFLDLQEFFGSANAIYEQLRALPTPVLRRAGRLGTLLPKAKKK
jgi:DNA-binding transcriptional regulator GbsR (MarR family)